jgi:hypothetical protein
MKCIPLAQIDSMDINDARRLKQLIEANHDINLIKDIVAKVNKFNLLNKVLDDRNFNKNFKEDAKYSDVDFTTLDNRLYVLFEIFQEINGLFKVEATTNKDENNGELSLTDWQRFFDNIQFNINEILTFWDADNERNGLSDYHKEIISKLRERLPDFDAYLIEHGDNSQTLSKMIEAMREVAKRCHVDVDIIPNGFVSWGNNSNDAIALSEQCNRWLRTYDRHQPVGALTPPQETPGNAPVEVPDEQKANISQDTQETPNEEQDNKIEIPEQVLKLFLGKQENAIKYLNYCKSVESHEKRNKLDQTAMGLMAKQYKVYVENHNAIDENYEDKNDGSRPGFAYKKILYGWLKENHVKLRTERNWRFYF